MPGETLAHFGESTLRWLDEWLKHGPESNHDAHGVSYETAVVKPDARDVSGPAHAMVLVRPPSDDQFQQRWLVSECCWSQELLEPTFMDLIKWVLMVYPWLAAAHFGIQVRRRWSQWARAALGWRWASLIPFLLLTLLYSIVLLIVTTVVCLLLTVLAVAAIPPIAALRRGVLHAQRTLTRSVGDSMIFIRSPLQSAAIVTRFLTDLRWVASRCDKVAIVAHSQGAAVTHLALKRGPLREESFPPLMLLTVGSGAGKLEELAELQDQYDWRRRLWGWLPLLGLVLFLLGLTGNANFSIGESRAWLNFANPIAIAVGVLCWLASLGLAALEAHQFGHDRFEPQRQYGRAICWHEFFATSDPVSNGALFDQQPTYLSSIRVHNHGSVISDHTSYWSNRDGFLSLIATVLAEFAGLGRNRKVQDPERLYQGWLRRRFRVRALVLARSLLVLAACTLVTALWSELTGLGREVAAKISTLPVLRSFDWISLSVDYIQAHEWASHSLGVAVVVVIGVLLYSVVAAAWSVWNLLEMPTLEQGKDIELSGSFWLFVLVLCLVVGSLLSESVLRTTGAPSHFHQVAGAALTLGMATAVIMLVIRFFRHGLDAFREKYLVPALGQSFLFWLIFMPVLGLIAPRITNIPELILMVSLLVIPAVLFAEVYDRIGRGWLRTIVLNGGALTTERARESRLAHLASKESKGGNN